MDGRKRKTIACIDAGGSTVRICIRGHDGAILHEARTVSPSQEEAIQRAMDLIRPWPARMDIVCAGIAGWTRDSVRKGWEEATSRAFPGIPIVLVADWEIALEGALPARDGILLQAGTGSVAVAKNGHLKVRVGGRGWEYGDEGSGSHATTEAIRRTMRALDGLAATTPLVEAMLLEMETSTPIEFGEACRRRSETEGKGFLLPALIAAAGNGNRDCAELLSGMAGWLARLVVAAADKSGMPASTAPNIVFSGGLRAADPWILPTLERILRRRWNHANVSDPVGSPIDGAWRLGLGHLPPESLAR